MKTNIVFVKFKQPGVSGSFQAVRYIDSQWADLKHATERKGELVGSFRMFDVPDFVIDIVAGDVADCQVGPRAESREDAP